MSFANQLAATIDAAPANQFESLAHLIWRGHAAGAYGDSDAQRLAEQLHERRKAAHGSHLERLARTSTAWSPLPRPPDPKSHDRRRSIERRRRLAFSGPMPPGLACKFTVGRLSVMRIVGDEWRAHGRCDKTMGELAARAGVCVRLAQLAIRQAEADGLITVQERRISAFMSDTNVIKVISPEWLAWLSMRPKPRPLPVPGRTEIHPTEPKHLERKGTGEKRVRPPSALPPCQNNESTGFSVAVRGLPGGHRPAPTR